MVLKVCAHARLVEHRGDPQRAKCLCRADAGQLQEAGGTDGARGQDHLCPRRDAAAIHHLDPHRPAAFDQQPPDRRAGAHGQVRPAPVRRQIGHRGGRPARVALGQLVIADAVLRLAVDVHVTRDAKCCGRLEIRLADRQRRDGLADAKGAALAVKAVLERVVILGLAEIGQHVVIAPAGAAHLAPVVVILRIAARVDLRVDGRTAAQHLRLRIAEDLALHVPLRSGVPAPGPDALGHFRETGGQVVKRVAVAAPGLEQQDLHGGVLAQPCGHDRPGRPGTDDDEIVALFHTVPLTCLSRPSAHPESSVLRIWSAARSDRAAMVRAGLTAAEVGRTEASVM